MPALVITICDDVSQFADYSTFASRVGPKSRALMICEHCENGFREKDVQALCDIAQSTKVNKKFIGQKGIGFKSVFKVTTTPVIHSGSYSFHFDSDALGKLGYLIPFPLKTMATRRMRSSPLFQESDFGALADKLFDAGVSEAEEQRFFNVVASEDDGASPSEEEGADSSSGPNGTRIVLPFSGNVDVDVVSAHMTEDIQPRLLLFLRNLRRLVLHHTARYKVVMNKQLLHESRNTHILLLSTVREGSMVRRDDMTAMVGANIENKLLSSYSGAGGAVSKKDAKGKKNVDPVAASDAQSKTVTREQESWFVFTEKLISPIDRGNADADLKIAFPFPQLQSLISTEQQHVFAWLPTRSYGFRFIIQADFVVATSREALIATDPFNQFVRDQVPTVFARAVEEYVAYV